MDHRTTKDITPSRAKALVQHASLGSPVSSLIKCMHCETPKERKEFYTSRSGRASPYCIDCNTDAGLKAKYRRELKKEGVTSFNKRIQRREYQIQLMLAAVVEFQKEGK